MAAHAGKLKVVPTPAAQRPADRQEGDPHYQAIRLRGLADLIAAAGDPGASEPPIYEDLAFFLDTELRQIAAALDGAA